MKINHNSCDTQQLIKSKVYVVIKKIYDEDFWDEDDSGENSCPVAVFTNINQAKDFINNERDWGEDWEIQQVDMFN